MAEMVEAGCIKDVTVDASGEVWYTWNEDILESKYPEVARILHDIQEEEISEALSDLVDKGLIEMIVRVNDDGTLEDAYRLTALGKEVTSDFTFPFDNQS